MTGSEWTTFDYVEVWLSFLSLKFYISFPGHINTMCFPCHQILALVCRSALGGLCLSHPVFKPGCETTFLPRQRSNLNCRGRVTPKLQHHRQDTKWRLCLYACMYFLCTLWHIVVFCLLFVCYFFPFPLWPVSVSSIKLMVEEFLKLHFWHAVYPKSHLNIKV